MGMEKDVLRRFQKTTSDVLADLRSSLLREKEF
jgi:hypothetical protein